MTAVALTSVTRKRTENVWRCGVSSGAMKGSRVTPTIGITMPAAIASRFPSSSSSPPIPTAETTTPPALDLRRARRLTWKAFALRLQYFSQSSDRSCSARLLLWFMATVLSARTLNGSVDGMNQTGSGPADALSAGPCAVVVSVQECPARGGAVESGIAAVDCHLDGSDQRRAVGRPVALRLVRLGCHRRVAFIVDERYRLRCVLGDAAGRLHVGRRRRTAPRRDLALVLVRAALAQTLELLSREVAQGLRDRVLALRLCCVETVGAGRVVAVDDQIQRVDVPLGTCHPRHGVGRAVAAAVTLGTVLLALRLLQPLRLGRGELHAGERGTAERREAIRPGVCALAGTLLALDEALRDR